MLETFYFNCRIVHVSSLTRLSFDGNGLFFLDHVNRLFFISSFLSLVSCLQICISSCRLFRVCKILFHLVACFVFAKLCISSVLLRWHHLSCESVSYSICCDLDCLVMIVVCSLIETRFCVRNISTRRPKHVHQRRNISKRRPKHDTPTIETFSNDDRNTTHQRSKHYQMTTRNSTHQRSKDFHTTTET